MRGCVQTQICDHIAKSISIKKTVLNDQKIIQQIESLAEDCLLALRSGGKIIFAGNGGSFSDAQHLAAEFTSRLMFDRAPLASIALGTNSSALSAVGNDYGFDQIFARELLGIGKVDDVFVPISTSGNSHNILAAIKVANDLGIKTFGLTGQSGGSLKLACNCIAVPSDETARIQECHIMVGHILCALVEDNFFQKRLVDG